MIRFVKIYASPATASEKYSYLLLRLRDFHLIACVARMVILYHKNLSMSILFITK